MECWKLCGNKQWMYPLHHILTVSLHVGMVDTHNFPHFYVRCCLIDITAMRHERVLYVTNRRLAISPDLLFCEFWIWSFSFLSTVKITLMRHKMFNLKPKIKENHCFRSNVIIDGVHPKTHPFFTRHPVRVVYKVVSQFSEPNFLSFSCLNSARHNFVLELCRA